MRFWDSSATVPLLVDEERTANARRLLSACGTTARLPIVTFDRRFAAAARTRDSLSSQTELLH